MSRFVVPTVHNYYSINFQITAREFKNVHLEIVVNQKTKHEIVKPVFGTAYERTSPNRRWTCGIPDSHFMKNKFIKSRLALN